MYIGTGQVSRGEGESADEDGTVAVTLETGSVEGTEEDAASSGAEAPEGGKVACKTGIESSGASKSGSGSEAASATNFLFVTRNEAESDSGSDVSIS